MKDKTENKFEQIQTKVSPEMFVRLKAIEKAHGVSIFKMLRMLAECIIRFMDDQHNLSEDLLRVIRMFENIPGWKRSICLAAGVEDMEIVEAFYVLREKGKNGNRLVHVERPVMAGDEQWTATYNIQTMMERWMELMNPSLYRHLRQLSVDFGNESILDTISTIATRYKDNEDEVALRLEFEQIDWYKGARMHEQQPMQRRNNKTMESMEIRFDKY